MSDPRKDFVQAVIYVNGGIAMIWAIGMIIIWIFEL